MLSRPIRVSRLCFLLLYKASAAGAPMFSMCFISFLVFISFLYLVWEERFYKGRGMEGTQPYPSIHNLDHYRMVRYGWRMLEAPYKMIQKDQNGSKWCFYVFHCFSIFWEYMKIIEN